MSLAPASAAVLVQEFFLPMPEQQIYTADSAFETGVGTTLDSIFSVVSTGDGAVVYYDQWEDGYETDLSNPTQSTTKVWGDGNDANGIAPGFVNDPIGLPSGTVLTLRNNVTLPRNPSTILYDARDRVAATKALVVSRAAWPTAQGSVFAGSVSVYSTIDYGVSFISPVGQDITNRLFQYVGMFVMAAQDNTAVTIDTDGGGTNTATTITLNRGESYLVNGGIRKGATVNATKPVQAQLLIGHIAGRYASDWFNLTPVSQWDDTYYTPVPTPASGNSTFVYLYNRNPSALAINYTTRTGSGSFSIPATNVFQFQMPQSSGAKFVSASGSNFLALCTVASKDSSDAAYNWGFTLVPKDALTTEAVVGWGPGSSDGTANGSPAWVTPVGNTTIYVDYNGDHLGSNSINGLPYDASYNVVALESKKIFDPDKNQTAMRIFTADGTLITAAWGEDADTAAAGNPYIDAGTIVLPFPTPTLTKTSTIVTDNSPAGLSTNDIIEYTVTLDNKGLLPLGNTVVIDAPSANLVYVPNTTTLDGSPLADSVSGTPFPLDAPGYTIPVILRAGSTSFKYRAQVTAPGQVSNSVNVAGTSISSQTTIAPTPPSGSTSCSLSFSDASGTTKTAYNPGENVYVTVADGDKNTASNSLQTISVVVYNNSRNDLETVTLTETGTNTGIFRNTVGLPTALASGLAQQDGTLNIVVGDTLTVTNLDIIYGDTCNASATIQAEPQTKVLYLSSVTATNTLYRIDPVAAGRTNTIQSVTLGSVASNSVVAVDAISSLSNSSASSLTIPHTTGAGTNRLMLVSVAIGRSGPGFTSVSSISCAGNSLTLVGVTNDTSNVRCEIWRLLNPPSVTTNVVITLAAANPVVAVVTTFTGVDQATPLGSYFGVISASAGKAATNIATSASGELVFSALGVDGDNSRPASAIDLTPGVGQTVLKTNNGGNFIGIATSTKAGSANVTNSWTWTASNQQWAFGAVSIKPAPSSGGAGNSAVTFTQTPTFCQNFIVSSAAAITITNFVTVSSGTMPTNPAITAQLKYGSTSIINLTNAAYNSASNTLVWSGTLSSNVTIPSGQAVTCTLTNAQSGVAYKVDYDSATKPSKITLPTTTVIDVSSMGIYDAAYPGGNLVTTPAAGQTLYVRTTVSDPFGSYDITGLVLSINGPGVASDISTNLTSGSVVSDDGCTKTYEYVWRTTADTGAYTLTATGNEGTEGITDTAAATVTLTALDLGTPGSAEFTSGNNGTSTNAYAANASVCVRVTDLDQNLTNSIAENLSVTVTSSSGDSETLTLTETSTNSGIFTSCLNTSTNSGSGANNGTLLAPAGSLLTVSYIDPTDSGDASSANATVLTAPGVAAIIMNKTLVSPADGQAETGEAVQFNLQVINSGSTTLTNISVTDTYPAANLTFVSASVTPNTVVAGTLTWTNLGSFPTGQITNITVNFTASNTASLMTNTARAASIGGTTNTDTATLTITRSALAITKTVIAPTNFPVGIGTNVTFRIVIQNTGTTTINTLPLEDSFSAGCFQYVTNVSGAPPDGVGAGSLLWNNLGPLAAGASITNDVMMKAVGSGQPAQNTAHADFAIDSLGNPVPSATSTASTTNIAARITGTVYNDLDRSGTVTGGDTGLADVVLSLYTDPNADGDPADGVLVQLTTSDVSGNYELLNLATGAYVVVETDLAGFASVSPLNNRIPVVFSALTTNAGNNFFDHVNGTPVANDDVAGTARNVAVTLNPLVNDSDIDNDELTITAVSPTNGTASILGGTNILFTPTSNFLGIAYVGYTISDSHGAAAAAVITINVTNRPPTATNDISNTARNTAVTVDPLTNDGDPDGDALTIISVSPTNGTAVIIGGTNVTFTPTNGLNSGTVGYTIVDGFGGTNRALITVNVTNRPPVAVNDADGTLKNVAITLDSASGHVSPLANDSDPDGDAVFITGVVSTNGIATFTTTNITYTPASNFTGVVYLAYTISDSLGEPASASIEITISEHPPVAATDSYTTARSPAISFDPRTNDNDPNGDPLSITDVTTTNGVVSFTTTNVTYTPDSHFVGLVQLVYTITDGFGGTDSALINVNVTNRPPAAIDDSDTTPEDVPVTLLVLTNDVELDAGDALTITNAVTTNGTVSILGGTNLLYTPSTNFHGTNVMTYTMTDGSGGSASAQVTVFVLSVNDLPVALDDTTNTLEDVVVTIDPLVNDSDVDGDALSITNALATNGVAVIVGGTNIVFTPDADFHGSATIGYTITDGNGGSASAVITVTVVSLNDVPLANDDSYTTAEDTALIVPAGSGVLTNDLDVDGDVLSALLVTGPAHGTLILNTNGGFTYTPTNNYHGSDSFIYQADDGATNGNTAVVTLTITPVNDLPVALNDATNTLEDVAVTIAALSNDSDVDGDVLSITNAISTNGVAVIVGGTNILFTPDANFHGTAVIDYSITDGNGGSASATITVTIAAVNDAPEANDDTFSVVKNNTLTVPAAGVLTNDTDVEGDVLTASVMATTTNGTLTLSTNGSFIYVPTSNYFGPDSFTYQVSDGTTNSAVATVTINVLPSNSAPVAADDSYTTPEDTTLTITVGSGVLTNDFDVDGNPLSAVLVSNVTHGALSLGTNGGFNYTPSADFNGTDTFTYYTADAATNSVPATVTIVVTPVNDAPVAVNDSTNTLEDVAVTIHVLVNDTDVDGETLTITNFATTNGIVSIAGTNLVFTPDTNFSGAVTLSYTITDGSTNTATADVLVNVIAVNDPPVAVNDVTNTVEDTAVVVQPLTNDTDEEGDPLTITNVITTNGVATIIGGTNILYTPATNYGGSASFDYVITDGHGGYATGQVTVAISRLADLQVLKTGPASATATSNVTYTITVTNFGPSTASNVVVSDVLPAGFVLQSSTPAGALLAGNTLSWQAIVLAENRSTNFTVTVRSTNGGSFTNIASAASTTPDPDTNNNNGSRTNAQAATVVTPLADISATKSGAASIVAGGSLVYTITISNAGPSSASSVTVTDALPASLNFSAASGGGVFTNGAVIWQLASLNAGASSNLTLTVTPTLAGLVTNIVRAGFPGIDPNPTNNNGTATSGRVLTVVTSSPPSADVAVLMTGSNNVTAGNAILYYITVTNQGPTAATNVALTDALPTNTVFVSASGSGVLSNRTVVWPVVPVLTNGGFTNYVLTLSVTNQTTNVIFVTNVASAFAVTFDPNLTNNNGTLPASKVATAVYPLDLAVLVGTPQFNPQISLYEERVTVTNRGAVTVIGLRLYPVGLRAGKEFLMYASGTNAGQPYILFNAPVSPGSNVTFQVEILSIDNRVPTNTFRVEAVVALTPRPVTGSDVSINRVFFVTVQGVVDPVIEFTATPGTVYGIAYSDDAGSTWKVASPYITATSAVMQWVDSGPPKTDSPSSPTRWYRVLRWP